MEELPGDVRGELAQAVGAYLRSAPAQQLAPHLRRYRGLRPQALGRHSNELVAVVDDPVVRRQIAEWLKTKPKLSSERFEILSLVTEQTDGWLEKVRARSAARPEDDGAGHSAANALREALEQEQLKVRRAREEARRARDEARRAAGEDRIRIAELSRRVAELEAGKANAIAGAASSERRAEAADKELERSRRRDQRVVAKAREERDTAKSELRRARRAVADASQRVAELEGRAVRPGPTQPSPSARAGAEPRTPPVRRPLPVPKGRLEDEAETLSQWLKTPDVTLLVDGYNVTLAKGGFGNAELEGQRERLVNEIRNLAVRYRTRPIIVFDGKEMPPGVARRPRGSVRVEYSTRGETADDHLIALLDELPNHPVIVVTKDRVLQERARAGGATIASSDQLLELLRRHAPR